MTGGIQRYTHALALAAAKVAGPANVLVLPFNGTYPVAQSEYMLNDKLARLHRLWGVVPRRWVVFDWHQEFSIDCSLWLWDVAI